MTSLNPSGPRLRKSRTSPLPSCGLADRDQVDPAVVVVVEGGHAPGASPIRLGQLHRLEALALIVAPQVSAGAPQWVKARSIQPSWLKSRTATPAASDAKRVAEPKTSGVQKLPSRGFWKTVRRCCHPVTNNIHGAIVVVVACPPQPQLGSYLQDRLDRSTSVNVPLPLLRHIRCAT